MSSLFRMNSDHGTYSAGGWATQDERLLVTGTVALIELQVLEVSTDAVRCNDIERGRERRRGYSGGAGESAKGEDQKRPVPAWMVGR
jgi:hypothetical protein